MPTDATLRELEHLLAAQRRLICAGDVAGATRCAKDMAAVLAHELPGGTPALESLAKLKPAFTENQRLLAAALQGVRAARNRLRAINDAGSELKTYDSNGQQASVPASPRKIEHRA